MLFQKGHTIDNRYTVVFSHKEGAYAETYRVRDVSGKLRFLKLIYYSKLQYSQFDKDGSIIEVKEERDVMSLFSAGETTALMGDVQGLDDFELICFLVIR